MVASVLSGWHDPNDPAGDAGKAETPALVVGMAARGNHLEAPLLANAHTSTMAV
jgi:hypothetical protein